MKHILSNKRCSMLIREGDNNSYHNNHHIMLILLVYFLTFDLLDLDFLLFRSMSHWALSQILATYKRADFFHQDLSIITWEKKEVKNKALCRFVQVSKEKIHPFYQICTEGQQGLLWAETHPPSKFCGNLLSSVFCNPADKPTNKETQPTV